ncbi:MAG: hypothetical protein Q8O70_11580, partial [Burkholderiales bacterium]|nr:hypothetical protein [Burkholderiales bacterium]
MLARLTGKSGGVEDLNIAEYPGPLGIHDPAQITQNIESDLLGRIVTGLTRGSGEAAAAGAVRDPKEIVFAGTRAEVRQYFDAQEWSDGLPIVAPSIERVERFLKFAARAPHEAVAVLQSANLQATPWNIAVNAVMAGCRPEHMPLILAAVEALGDERCSLNNIGSTSGIFPFVLINGPIVDQLGIQSGAQLASRPPNPAIGRAIGLIVRNIAGFRPGSSYMGTFGYPLAVALAERAGESPWEPFHVEQGYDRNANTVTVGVTNNWGSSPAPYDRAGQSGAQIALELLAREITKKTRLYNFPGRGPQAETVMLTLLLAPPVARSLAAAGYSKQDVKQHLYENTRMSLREFDWISRFTSISGITARERIDEGVFPKEFAGAPDD